MGAPWIMKSRRGYWGPIWQGTISADHNGQIIEDGEISAAGFGVLVNGFSNVTIRRCRILYNGSGGAAEACGIKALATSGVTIEDCELINMSAPKRGALATANKQGILISGGGDATVSRVTVRRGSDSVRLVEVNGSHIDHLESHDVRGPKPRGMAIQLASCTGAHLIEDVSDESIPGTSNNEDNFSVFKSPNVTMRRIKLPIGTDAESGRGLVIEGGSSDGCTVEEAEFLWMFNGALGAGATYGEEGVYPDGFALSGIRTKHWNRYGVHAWAGSSGKAPDGYPPASFSLQAAVSGTYDILYWDRGYPANLSWNVNSSPINVSGTLTQQNWAETLSVVRNAFPWRSVTDVPIAELAARIGSYWSPGDQIGTGIVEGSVLGLLPGRYRYDPTSRLWQWRRDGEPIAGATGLNYVAAAADRGHAIDCVEVPANDSGSGEPMVTAAVQVAA